MRLMLLTKVVWIGMSSALPGGDAPFAFHEPVRPPRAVQIIAHRGLRSVAPENSAAAVHECAGDYIEWAAIDVRRTRDGHHVVIHDDAMSTVGLSSESRVAEMTLAQVRALEVGAAFAQRFEDQHSVTLPKLLAAVGTEVNLVLRCKGTNAPQLVREIDAANCHSRVLIAGSEELLHAVHALDRAKFAVQVSWQPQRTSLAELLARDRPAVVELSAEDVTADRCCGLHALGVRVHANALGEANDCAQTWTRLFEAGVDAILTDNPAGVRFCEVRRRVPHFPVQIAFHRGAARYAPENTLPAIQMAADLGADYVEIDVRTTQDGRFVLLHDRTLERTTTGRGAVNEQPAAAIAGLDAGAWFSAQYLGVDVPSFDDALRALGAHSSAYLDAKDIPPEALLAAIRRHGLMQRNAIYQSVDYCRRLKSLDPDVRIQPPLRRLDDLDAVIALSPYSVDASWSILSAELIDRCHAAGILVNSDALGEHETLTDYRRAIDWGVDLIQTDYPLRVLRAIELEAESRPAASDR